MDEEAAFFRDQLRQARAAALRDAEGYQDLLYCFERLGLYCYKRRGLSLNGKMLGLRLYKDVLADQASKSPLAVELPRDFPECHTDFEILYNSVVRARNDALHQGAVARHLTMHAIETAIVLEDSLVNHEALVSAYMVRNPVRAFPWQPLSFLRQVMLSESFSYLPVWCVRNGGQRPHWYLISDYNLAQALKNKSNSERNLALATTLEKALLQPGFAPKKATVVPQLIKF